MRCTVSGKASFLRRVVTYQGRSVLTVNALAAFSLAEPGTLLEPGEAWELLAKARGRNLLDLGVPKLRGEYLVSGACHAPGGRAVRSCLVSVAVGGSAKTLTVLGERRWRPEGDNFASLDEPAPFTVMPIVWERAFGGPASKDNTLGTGLPDPGKPDAAVSMPNVEYPDRLVVNPRSRPFPAGFDAMREARVEKRKRFGTYDERWLAEDWPGVPRDYDFELVCWAPPDQRLAGYFRGDEPVRVQNMHPSMPFIESRLPGKRTRFFVRTQAWAPPHAGFQEIPANLDTVWLLPGEGKGVLVWRGVLGVCDEDASDVLDVLAVVEDLDAPARPAGEYESLLEERPGAVPAKPQSPPEAEAAAAQATPGAAPKARADEVPPQAPPKEQEGPSFEEMMAEARAGMEKGFAKLGISPASLVKTPGEVETTLGALMDKSLAEGAARLKAMGLTPDLLAGTAPAGGDPEAALASAKALGELLQTRVDALAKGFGKVAPDAAAAGQPAGRSPFSLALDKLGLGPQAMERLNKTAGAVRAALDEAAAGLAAMAGPETAGRAGTGVHAEAGAGGEPMPGPPPEPAPGSLTRQDVLDLRAAGRPLAGLDLTGADLSGLDLSGSDLGGAVLEKANLDGTVLAGANLQGALLAGASARGADFARARCQGMRAPGLIAPKAALAGADIRRSDLTGASLAGASLAGSSMEESVLEKADLAGADLSGSRAGRANLAGAFAPGACFAGILAREADFSGAVLDRADFSRSSLAGARFTAAKATGAAFAGADMAKSRSTGEGVFARADFSGANLEDAIWRGGDFRQAIFLEARLNRARFDESRLVRARLAGIPAREASFQKADLTGADLRGSDFLKASFHAATLLGGRFDGASLFGADLTKAILQRASFENADVGRTRLAWRPPLGEDS
jgi:uncharacterized protein YjbI with pentapeptide repeats